MAGGKKIQIKSLNMHQLMPIHVKMQISSDNIGQSLIARDNIYVCTKNRTGGS